MAVVQCTKTIAYTSAIIGS